MGHGKVQEKGLRIAWQYKKYFGEQQTVENHRGKMDCVCVRVPVS